jgi:hypothetical protein
MAPHQTTPRTPSRATAVAVAPGMVRQHDLLVAAPAVLAVLAGVLLRAL